MMTMKLSMIVLAGSVALASCLFADTPATQPAESEKVTCESGLVIVKTRQPSEQESGARAGDHIWVHYAGRLENGTEFDNSYSRGEPIDIDLGRGQVIKGWDEGLVGMKIGEKRQLIIPAKLGYGERGAGGGKIPPNATLIFDVELMGIRRS